MYTVIRPNRTAADLAADVRSVVRDQVPKITAKALTFTAQKAQADIVAAMPRVFEGGASAYTRNSTRIEPATVATLSARVAVKDRTTNNGTLPEDYLFPEVFGGARKEKRFERAMRYAGVLQPGTFTVLGRDVPRSLLDAQGNLKGSELARLMSATRTSFDGTQRKTGSARSRRNQRNAPYFVGGLDDVRLVGGEVNVRKGRMQPGVYRREGRGKILPVLIFVKKRPTYRTRLDFDGIAQATAQREFEPTFRRLLAAAQR
jgi:hypothetical protein